MDIDKINNLMSSLEALKADKNYSKISIQLTSEELDVLVGRIYEYTMKLASDNEIEIAADDLEEEKMLSRICNLILRYRDVYLLKLHRMEDKYGLFREFI